MADDDPQAKKMEIYGGDKQPSEFQSTASRWLRRVIIGLLVLVMLVALVWFALIGPRAAQISQLESQVAAANDQVATLEANVAELELLKPQRDVLSLLADANTARFELQRSQPESAAAALLNSARTLAQLKAELGGDFAETIANLETRLGLAREDIADEDRFAALSDLEVYVGILLQLQRSLLSQ